MSFRKEILILIFVLVGCLVIVFSDFGQSDNKLQSVEEPSQKEIPVPSQSLGIFQQIQESSHPTIDYSVAETNSVEENDNFETITSRPEENTEILSQASLSLEDILAEVKNLSSDLKLEFENIKNQKESCPSCGQSENTLTSICTTILGSPGGMVCNCATLGCTPPPPAPWCVHPCCWACCQACCLWGF